MSLTYSTWLGGTLMTAAQRTERTQERAADAWQRINEKPTSIVLRTAAGATRAAQTVRVEFDNTATPAESAAGVAPKRKVIVFGIRGHATLADTLMAEGDRFVLDGDELRCVDIIVTLGEIQGIFESAG
jgi:hypothetical protein